MSPELERFAGNRVQRRVVIEAIAAARQPFAARSLWEMVKTRDALVSRATVYRTLRLLRESGLVRMTVLPSGNRVFHIDQPVIFWTCDDCSRIRAFSCDELKERARFFAEANGFHRVEISVEVHSYCEDLRQRGSCGQDSGRAKKDRAR